MATPPADRTIPLLRLGRVDQLRFQVGYRAHPDGPAYQHFLLDLPFRDPAGAEAFDERPWLAVLEPVVYAGADVPHHYSVHEHRWHTSWGAAPGGVDIGLLVTMGKRAAAESDVAHEAVTLAFRSLLDLAGRPEAAPVTRELAITRARRAVAASYALDPDRLALSTEQHHAEQGSWHLRLRISADHYEVVTGFLDGYAGATWMRHHPGIEVNDSVGAE